MSQQPFFIVGPGRTGSSFLFSLLRVHPRVALSNEAHLFSLLRRFQVLVDTRAGIDGESGTGVLHDEYRAAISTVLREQMVDGIARLYAQLACGRDFTHWGDKLTRVEALPLIHELYPAARHIVLLRDPRDLICSIMRYGRLLPFHPDYLDRSLPQLCALHRETYDIIAQHITAFVPLRYEDLIQDPRRSLTTVLDFLGLDHHPACFAAIETEGRQAAHGTSVSPEHRPVPTGHEP